MKEKILRDTLSWYVIHTKPKQEQRAASNLKAWGVETFAPYSGERRSVSHIVNLKGGQGKPLFPRYIFAKFRAREFLNKVCFTRGVSQVVCFGDEPIPVDDEVIALIRSRLDSDGFVRLGEELKPGDQVVIKDGPLSNLMGIFDKRISGTNRVSILLTTISYQVHIVIEKERIEKVKKKA